MNVPEQNPALRSKLMAWRNAMVMPLLGCLMGYGGFAVLGKELPARLPLFEAAVVLQLYFAAALAAILAVILVWQRSRGLSLAELGWRRPTTRTAVAIALMMGALYITGAYFGARQLLKDVDVLEITLVRLALVPVGIFMAIAEETMMRGFFMTELHRARVSAWIQIVASGACSAVYHSLQDPSFVGFLPSFVLFTLHAGLYVLGKRSLTPVSLAHGIYNAFGEPYLLMMAMAAMSRH